MATYYLYIFDKTCLYREPVIEKTVRGMSLEEAKRELEKRCEWWMSIRKTTHPYEFHQEAFITEHPWWRNAKICKREWAIKDGQAAWCGPWEDCCGETVPYENAERAA